MKRRRNKKECDGGRGWIGVSNRITKRRRGGGPAKVWDRLPCLQWEGKACDRCKPGGRRGHEWILSAASCLLPWQAPTSTPTPASGGEGTLPMEVHKHPISLILRLGTHSPSTRRPIVASPRALNGTCVSMGVQLPVPGRKWKQATGGSNPSQALHFPPASRASLPPSPTATEEQATVAAAPHHGTFFIFLFLLFFLSSQSALQTCPALCLLRVGVCSVHYFKSSWCMTLTVKFHIEIRTHCSAC